MLFIGAGCLLGIAYYLFLQIDLVGYRDPQAVAESQRRMNNILLSAEFRKGTDYCNIELLDSSSIQINAGDSAGSSIITKPYTINGDTIIVLEGIEHVEKYMNTHKLIIRNDKILYLLNSLRNYDTNKVWLSFIS